MSPFVYLLYLLKFLVSYKSKIDMRITADHLIRYISTGCGGSDGCDHHVLNRNWRVGLLVYGIRVRVELRFFGAFVPLGKVLVLVEIVF